MVWCVGWVRGSAFLIRAIIIVWAAIKLSGYTKYAQEDALACERLSSLVRNHLKLWSPVMVRRVLHPECLPAAQDARETCLFGSWVGGGSARCGSRAARERGARACEGGVVVELCARDCVGEERSW